MTVKDRIKAVPLLGPAAKRLAFGTRSHRFPGSADYWERRYVSGGTSGAGSYGEVAEYKAGVLNGFVRERNVGSVIEWGCGDGHQLSLAEYPEYIGVDVSDKAIELCMRQIGSDPTKSFYGLRAFVDNARLFRAELALSLEVIFHLIEDDVFDEYMSRLFASADRFVVIYCTDEDRPQEGPHERRRKFTSWISRNASHWDQVDHIVRAGKTDALESDFYVFERRPLGGATRAGHSC